MRGGSTSPKAVRRARCYLNIRSKSAKGLAVGPLDPQLTNRTCCGSASSGADDRGVHLLRVVAVDPAVGHEWIGVGERAVTRALLRSVRQVVDQ